MPPATGATEEEIDDKLDALLGEPPQEEPEEKPEEAAEEEPEGEPEAEPDKGPENKDDEPDKEPDEGKEEEPEKEAEGNEVPLADLAKILGVDESRLDVENDQIFLKTKVDGVEGKASVEDVLKSYQLEGHLNKQNMEVVEQRKALEQAHQAFQQERQGKLQQLEDTLTLATKELEAEYNSVDWNSLKQSDPQQYTTLRLDMQDRHARLQGMYTELQQARNQQAEQFQQARQQALQQEYARMAALIPGLEKEETRQTTLTNIRQAFAEANFSPEETEAISNAMAVPPQLATKIIHMAYKAGEYDRLQKAKPAVEKKVKTAPRVVKSGTPEEKNNVTDLKAAVAKVRKSGGEKGIDEYLEQKLGIK